MYGPRANTVGTARKNECARKMKCVASRLGIVGWNECNGKIVQTLSTNAYGFSVAPKCHLKLGMVSTEARGSTQPFYTFFRDVKLFKILKNCELWSIGILVYFTKARPPPAKSSQTSGRRWQLAASHRCPISEMGAFGRRARGRHI